MKEQLASAAENSARSSDRQHWSGSMTRHASTAKSGSRRCPNDFETELVETTERGQVRTREGSVRHVEVFQVDGVSTPILDVHLGTDARGSALHLSTAKSRIRAPMPGKVACHE